MDRPGLQKLLADVRAGKIDVVVVYKVDRLSRSLADFAQIIQLFDEHGVSFVFRNLTPGLVLCGFQPSANRSRDSRSSPDPSPERDHYP